LLAFTSLFIATLFSLRLDCISHVWHTVSEFGFHTLPQHKKTDGFYELVCCKGIPMAAGKLMSSLYLSFTVVFALVEGTSHAIQQGSGSPEGIPLHVTQSESQSG